MNYDVYIILYQVFADFQNLPVFELFAYLTDNIPFRAFHTDNYKKKINNSYFYHNYRF